MLKTLMVTAALFAGVATVTTANATTTHKKHVRMLAKHHTKSLATFNKGSNATAGGGNATATGGTPGGFTDRK